MAAHTEPKRLTLACRDHRGTERERQPRRTLTSSTSPVRPRDGGVGQQEPRKAPTRAPRELEPRPRVADRSRLASRPEPAPPSRIRTRQRRSAASTGLLLFTRDPRWLSWPAACLHATPRPTRRATPVLRCDQDYGPPSTASRPRQWRGLAPASQWARAQRAGRFSECCVRTAPADPAAGEAVCACRCGHRKPSELSSAVHDCVTGGCQRRMRPKSG
jgi:hypothetical protein